VWLGGDVRCCRLTTLGVAFADPGLAAWKWAEMMAGLYEREAVSHSELGAYERPPLMATRGMNRSSTIARTRSGGIGL
jgi:hypothetical protein